MNLKYPKIKTGLNFVYISIWLGVAGKLFTKAFAYAEAVLEISFISEWMELIMALIASVVMIVGVYIASKDEKRYRIVFLVALAELAMSFVYGMSSASTRLVVIVIAGVISMLAALLRYWLICRVTVNILQKEGNENIAKKGTGAGICYAVLYGCNVLVLILSLLDKGEILGTWLVFPASVASVAGWILYVIFLHQTTDFFEKLSEDEMREIFHE